MTWRILGGLGEGRFAPLLAEEVHGERVRRVVLHRPTALFGVVAAGVVADEAILELPEGMWAVSRYVPGWDVDAVLAAHPNGIPEPALTELFVGVQRSLRAGGHGALSGATVRITPQGDVFVLGFRDGEDAGVLAELRESWAGPGAGTLVEVMAALSTTPAELIPHPLSGKILSRGEMRSAVPNKVRNAAFAGVTLVLGLAAGWFLAGGV